MKANNSFKGTMFPWFSKQKIKKTANGTLGPEYFLNIGASDRKRVLLLHKVYIHIAVQADRFQLCIYRDALPLRGRMDQ